MRTRGPARRAGARMRVPVMGAALAFSVIALTAGCGAKGTSGAAASPSPGGTQPTVATPPAASGTDCGTTKTAANVPIHVYLSHSKLPCSAAMSVQQDYAKAIRDGSAPGNGGGGPVKIDGWTCQGFATPVVLQTGQASKCVRGKAEILAILPPPT